MTRTPGPLAFPLTPAEASGRVDAAALRRLVVPLVAARVDSIGVLGSTGTYAYLNRAERRRAVDTALDAAAEVVPVLVGVGALRTDDAVALAQDARAAGAAAGLLAPMSYTPLTDDEVFDHYATVARLGGLPLCIYDNPGTTHFRFSPALLTRLGQIDGIVALTSPAAEPQAVATEVETLRSLLPPRITLGFSVDWHATEALLAGGEAWHSVAAGLFPRSCLRIVAAVRDRAAAEARRLDAGLAPLWRLFREFTSLRVAYAAAEALGLCHAAPPRPILPLPTEVRRRVARTVASLGLD